MRRLFLIAIVAAGLACRPDITYPEGCWTQDPISISASVEAVPLFQWTCGITDLEVHEAEPGQPDGKLMWQVNVPDNQLLRGPIRYGRAPSRATVYHAAEPLSCCKYYRVSVRYILGGDAGVSGGYANFRWFPPD